MWRVDSLCLYTKDATYQRKCFGKSGFWTSLCVLWQDSQSFVLGRRGWGHWLSAGQKMNLCFDVGFSITPPSLTGEALSTWDTTKSLSDIFSVPVISRWLCKGPHWPVEWKFYINCKPSVRHNCFFTLLLCRSLATTMFVLRWAEEQKRFKPARRAVSSLAHESRAGHGQLPGSNCGTN